MTPVQTDVAGIQAIALLPPWYKPGDPLEEALQPAETAERDRWLHKLEDDGFTVIEGGDLGRAPFNAVLKSPVPINEEGLVLYFAAELAT